MARCSHCGGQRPADCKCPCRCLPCRTCGFKHTCNLNVVHLGGWVRVDNTCPPTKIRLRRLEWASR